MLRHPLPRPSTPSSRDRGAQLITVHASWGAGPGKLEQWTLLARARALDSTCFVAAVDQGYPGDEMATASKAPTGVGGSLVASPLGEVVASAGDDPQLVVADIDIDSRRSRCGKRLGGAA